MDKEAEVYIHIMEYHSAIKKKKILPFATIWIDLEGIMLSEISQTKTNTVLSHFMWNPKNKNVNL